MSHSHQGHISLSQSFLSLLKIQSGKPFRMHFGEELSPCKTSIQTWSQSSSYHCTLFNYICLGESLSPRAYHYHDHFLSLPTFNLVNLLECTLVRNSHRAKHPYKHGANPVSYHCTFFNYICLGESLSPRAYSYHILSLNEPTSN